MTKGMTGREPDARTEYAEIIDLPHWESVNHPHMSLYDRAAQFAPFAALTGYDDMVTEEARLVDNRIELDDTSIEILNRKLSYLADMISGGRKPQVTITYFVPDQLKSGGQYETVCEEIRSIDNIKRQLVLEKRTGFAGQHSVISIEDIIELHSEELDSFEE